MKDQAVRECAIPLITFIRVFLIRVETDTLQ